MEHACEIGATCSSLTGRKVHGNCFEVLHHAGPKQVNAARLALVEIHRPDPEERDWMLANEQGKDPLLKMD